MACPFGFDLSRQIIMTPLPRFTLGCLLVALSITAGQAPAAGPEVRGLLPSGGQRGTTVEATVSGRFPQWPVQVWVDRPGIAVSAAAEKGKLSLALAADAAPGVAWLRLFDADAASAPRPFVVGTQLEIVEQEPNDGPRKAQAVAGPTAVVNGCLSGAGDVDVYAVELRQGQTLVAALVANNTLGSPMDAAMQIVGRRGNVEAFNHDQQGLDPRIEFTAPADGRWLVRVFAFPSQPNSTIGFAGGDAFVYRLSLTTGPYADYAWPLALTRGRIATLEIVGWNLPDSLRSRSLVPEGQAVEIADPRLANVVEVSVEEHETLVEVEPNEPVAAQAIPLPCTISGRLDTRGDVDAYRFTAAKGETVLLQLTSRALGFPLDGVLEVTDLAGKSLAKLDDSGAVRDPAIAFPAPADGEYRVLVTDLNRQGSARHAYRLLAKHPVADFTATVDSHAYVITPEKPAEITVSVARQHGFAEEIDFAIAGLPETVTMAPGRSFATGDSSKSIKLVLSSKGAAFSGPVRVTGQSYGASKLSRPATWRMAGAVHSFQDLWLTVVAASK
jgi:hypothetical protein